MATTASGRGRWGEGDQHSDNFRLVFGWRGLLLSMASRLPLCRRIIGGRWEFWWVEPCASLVWVPVTRPSTARVTPGPECLGGAVAIEDYTKSGRLHRRGGSSE